MGNLTGRKQLWGERQGRQTQSFIPKRSRALCRCVRVTAIRFTVTGHAKRLYFCLSQLGIPSHFGVAYRKNRCANQSNFRIATVDLFSRQHQHTPGVCASDLIMAPDDYARVSINPLPFCTPLVHPQETNYLRVDAATAATAKVVAWRGRGRAG